MPMNSAEAQDLRERLKPFRRILDGLGDAVDAVVALEEKAQGLRAELPALEDERNRLAADRDQKQAELAAAETEFRTRTRQMAERDRRDQAAREERARADDEARTQAERAAADLKAQRDQEHREAMAAYADEIAQRQKRVDALKAEETAIQDRLAPLLRSV